MKHIFLGLLDICIFHFTKQCYIVFKTIALTHPPTICELLLIHSVRCEERAAFFFLQKDHSDQEKL
jgi:hypothetical protein